ncbi:MAG: hypothetical protein D6706_04970 [Chloroflexi bacterium]|nr:MAG: hypothetical protein D6706_04970 [Chloroflexota bacterium]
MGQVTADRRALWGVFLVSMGALALEIVLTRIFSVTMWYHFAFLAISMALMGSAVAGVFLYFRPGLKQRVWIGRVAALLAVSVPVTFWVYVQIPFAPVLMNRTDWFNNSQLLWLALIYLVLAVPFFLTGMVIAMALSAWAAVAGRVYGADLAGASLGCLLSVVALERLGGTGALLLVGVVLSLAAVVLGWKRPFSRREFALPLLAVLVTGSFFFSQLYSPWLQITVNKAGGVEPTPVYERWNAHSRVTVYEPQGYPFFWAVSPENWEKTVNSDSLYTHALLLIDAVAGTPVQQFDGNLERVSFLRYDLTSLVYHLVEQPRTLVIGPGGGRDVLAALASGAPEVTAVEVNPAVIEAVRGPFADFAGHLYERPDVRVVVADARGFVERSTETYDVIQASLIDTWAAGGSGAFALSENSLYTQEAFRAYYEHLSNRGVLTVSRWYLPERPAETMRLIATGMAGWRMAGVTDPREHIIVVINPQATAQTEGLSTVLFGKRPFTPQDIQRVQQAVGELGYTLLYAPGLPPQDEVSQFVATADHESFIAQYPLDISPATDNRPFFFNLVLFGDLFDSALSGSGVYRTSMEAIVILLAVLGISAFFGLLFILIPLWAATRRGHLARPSASWLLYFALLGIGFMLVEIPTIQKLTVYLGRPVYSLAVVLFSLLLFSGLGSMWSNRWSETETPIWIGRMMLALVVIILLHAWLSAPVLAATLHWSLVARMLLAVLWLSVLGFLLGMPFPTAVRWVGTRQAGAIPWFWGVNGVMSVLGSALATTISIHAGFRWTLLVAALVYGSAWLVLWRGMHPIENVIKTAEPRLSVGD